MSRRRKTTRISPSEAELRGGAKPEIPSKMGARRAPAARRQGSTEPAPFFLGGGGRGVAIWIWNEGEFWGGVETRTGERLNLGSVDIRHPSQRPSRSYFLWRCRRRSFRCLCLRIFLRRFLMTLPAASSPCSSTKFGARPCLEIRSVDVNYSETRSRYPGAHAPPPTGCSRLVRETMTSRKRSVPCFGQSRARG